MNDVRCRPLTDSNSNDEQRQVAVSGAESRRERNRQEMREDILDAARRLVTDTGIRALSMRGIAREIDYSPAAIYEYFPSKAHLQAALFFQGREGLAGRVRDAVAALPADAPAIARVRAAGLAYRAHALENAELYRLTFNNPEGELEPKSEAGFEEDEGFRLLVDLMRTGIDNGELAAADPLHAALLAWSVVHGFVMLEINGFLPEEPPGVRDTLFDAVTSQLRTGLLARDGDAPS